MSSVKHKIISWLVKKLSPHIRKELYLLDYGAIEKRIDADVGLRMQMPITISGKVIAGDNLSIGAYSHFWAEGGIRIGNNVMIGSHCALVSVDHDPTKRIMKGHNIEKSVEIGDNVWIGAHSVIFPGVKIGSDSIVGAGSIVRCDVPPGMVVAGVPSKVIYNRMERISNE